MSGSSIRGKNWIEFQLKKIKRLFEVNEVLDIATGSGTYSNRYRNIFSSAKWTGIEIWKDFVEKYDLKSKYDDLIVGDARTFDYAELSKIDIAFAGDVLEHMTKEEAISLVDNTLKHTRCLFVSIPVIYWPQDEFEGNPYEVHVKPDWSDKEFLETFGDKVILAHVDVNIGVYVLSTDADFIKHFSKPTVAVYAICLNEIKFVDRFVESCKDADIVVISDTGSTDGTPQRLKELGVEVHSISQKPWRFDIARNASLNLVPTDIDLCVCLDLDEILMPGWRELLDQVWKDSKGTITRARYDFIWNWKNDGITPDVRFLSNKIHHRNNYYWRHPCHESLYWFGEGQEKSIVIDKLQVQHHADNTKSRGQYLSLLKQAVIEDPENDRMRYYYARELMYYNQFEESIKESLHHLSMPSARWNEERAASYRNISQSYRHMGKMTESQAAALKGVLECLTSREAWLQLSLISQLNKDWNTSYWAAAKCLEIKNRTMSYTGRSSSWGSEPYDHAALAAYYLGLYQQASDYGSKALELSPDDKRLQKNLKFYLEKI